MREYFVHFDVMLMKFSVKIHEHLSESYNPHAVKYQCEHRTFNLETVIYLVF